MKIGIDTFSCQSGVSGVGVYLTQILKRIPPSGAYYELFGWERDRFSFTDTAVPLEFVSRCSIEGRRALALWYQGRFERFAEGRRYTTVFFPAAHKGLPWRSRFPTVGTVHDMAAFWGTRKTREHLGPILRIVQPNALRSLDRVIAVSEWVKGELIEAAGVRESKIEVIPGGVDLSVFHPRPADDDSVVLIQPFSFRRPYILYASRLAHPIKNHTRLIEAFSRFRDKARTPHRLVFAGPDDVGAAQIKAAAARSKYHNDIFFTGSFPSESLPKLTAGADMVIYPSLYEGFGLGVLEAMASGVSVACSNVASLPECAGEAALYFNPENVDEIAERMVQLSGDRALKQRYAELGLERAKLYSWDACAEKTLRLIQETC